MIAFQQDRHYLAWAEERLGQRFEPAAATWLTSLSQTGNILGVVIFSRFTTGGCEVTVVGRERVWLSKGFVLACLAYVFLQLEKQRVTAFIAVDNEKSLSLAQQLGFRIEGRCRNWFPSGDAFILGLLREECKFLKDFHGQPKPAAST